MSYANYSWRPIRQVHVHPTLYFLTVLQKLGLVSARTYWLVREMVR